MRQAAASVVDEPEWARTTAAKPSHDAEDGTALPDARNPLRADVDDAEPGHAELVRKQPLNRNVKVTLCYQPALNVCTSLATSIVRVIDQHRESRPCVANLNPFLLHGFNAGESDSESEAKQASAC